MHSQGSDGGDEDGSDASEGYQPSGSDEEEEESSGDGDDDDSDASVVDRCVWLCVCFCLHVHHFVCMPHSPAAMTRRRARREMMHTTLTRKITS